MKSATSRKILVASIVITDYPLHAMYVENSPIDRRKKERKRKIGRGVVGEEEREKMRN